MSEERTLRVLKSLGKRISQQGDMPIRISRRTFSVLMRALGVKGWENDDDFREVDALALDLLRHLAWQRLA